MELAGLVGAGGVLVCDVLKSVMEENNVEVGKPVDSDLVQAILDMAQRQSSIKR